MKAKIYQIKDIENCEYAFRGYRPECFNFADYKHVYTLPELNVKESNIDILEDLFAKSNLGRLTYDGHSISVSDVICLYSGDDEHIINPKYYYCDMCGWVRLYNFSISAQSYLKKQSEICIICRFTNERFCGIIYTESSEQIYKIRKRDCHEKDLRKASPSRAC